MTDVEIAYRLGAERGAAAMARATTRILEQTCEEIRQRTGLAIHVSHVPVSFDVPPLER